MKLFYSSSWVKKPNFSLFYEEVKHTLLKMSSEEKYFTRALRTTLIVLFTLQLLSTLERQVFDFLGYMWAPIIGNFFQIIVVILGLFGACNFYRSFIVVYTVWNLLWLGWNIFVICLYLEVGILNRNRNLNILTIGTEGKSWWLEHGIGCKVTDDDSLGTTTVDGDDDDEVGMESTAGGGRKIPPESSVVGCILQYYYVEVIHAAVQVLLSVLGFVASSVSIYLSTDEEYSMSSANDELEFVKMRYRAPTHVSSYRDEREAMAFDNLNLTTEFTPEEYPVSRSRSHHGSMRSVDHRASGRTGRRAEQPPSYDTTMRNTMDATVAATNYYASDRQSVRSKASTRSKRNNRHGRSGDVERGYDNEGSATYSDPRRDLPWVQITPSTSHNNNGTQDSHGMSSGRNYFV